MAPGGNVQVERGQAEAGREGTLPHRGRSAGTGARGVHGQGMSNLKRVL